MLFFEKLTSIAVGSTGFNNKNIAKKQTKPLVIVQNVSRENKIAFKVGQ